MEKFEDTHKSKREPTLTGVRLKEEKQHILELWIRKLKQSGLPSINQPEPILIDEVPDYLDHLAKLLIAKRKLTIESTSVVCQRHGKQRAKLKNYTLDAMLSEYFLLRESIFEVLRQSKSLSEGDTDCIFSSIQIAMAEAARKYTEETESQMAAGEVRLKEAAEASGIGVWEMNCINKDIWRTNTDHRLFGFPTDIEKWTFEMFLEIVHPEDKKRVSEVFGNILKTKDQWSLNYRILWPDQSIHWIESKGKVLRNEKGVAIKLIGTNMDITQKKKDEEERFNYIGMAHMDLNKLRAEREVRERFVLTLTHDLRTPLTSAKMGAEILLRYPNKNHGQTILRIIDSINRADNMIQDLLDANRIRAEQKLPVQINRCDLKALLENTVEELRSVYGDRLVLEMPKDNIIGYWSYEGLRRVIENLVNNAVKYGSPHTKISILVSRVEKKIQLNIHNFGGVLNQREQETLFDQFRRTKDAEASGIRGWGIGLTLVRGIVEAHNGTVRVKSGKEEGTTFTVTLPIDARS